MGKGCSKAVTCECGEGTSAERVRAECEAGRGRECLFELEALRKGRIPRYVDHPVRDVLTHHSDLKSLPLQEEVAQGSAMMSPASSGSHTDARRLATGTMVADGEACDAPCARVMRMNAADRRAARLRANRTAPSTMRVMIRRFEAVPELVAGRGLTSPAVRPIRHGQPTGGGGLPTSDSVAVHRGSSAGT